MEIQKYFYFILYEGFFYLCGRTLQFGSFGRLPNCNKTLMVLWLYYILMYIC